MSADKDQWEDLSEEEKQAAVPIAITGCTLYFGEILAEELEERDE